MPAITYPTYTVDGVPLDATGWYLTRETRRRALPGVRAVSVKVPGRAGELPITGLDVDTTTLTLGLWVTCRRPDGSEGDLPDLEANLEALYGLFGVRHRMLDVRHLPAPGVERQADATVLAAADPQVNVALRHATLQVVLTIPGVFWRDVTAFTWVGALPGQRQVVTHLAGSTAPITDAVIRITGPATNPRVTDEATGGTVRFTGAVAAGRRLLIDCGRLRASLVDEDTWDLDAGSDVTGQVDSTGPGSAHRWLHLTPTMSGGDPYSRTVTVTTAATATTSASGVEIRARRAYL